MLQLIFRGEINIRRRLPSLQPLFFMLIAALAVSSLIAFARKDVTLSIDGNVRKITTFSLAVAGVLAEAGIVTSADDLLIPAMTASVTEGMEISLKQAFPVSVHADGEVVDVYIAQATVEDILQKLGLTLGELDRVEPARDYQLSRGDTVQVIRVERRLITQRVDIPYREIRRGTAQLDRGVSRVVDKGIYGLREDTVEITVENGVEVSTKIIQSDLLRIKFDRIVEYGENTVLSRGGRSMQFLRVYTVSATAYCAGTVAAGCPIDSAGYSICTGKYNSGRTATGQSAIAGDGSESNPHLVAVDPRVFPMGSRFYIDGYGFALAADRGSAVNGRHIDILFPTHESALRFGRRQLRVYHMQ